MRPLFCIGVTSILLNLSLCSLSLVQSDYNQNLKFSSDVEFQGSAVFASFCTTECTRPSEVECSENIQTSCGQSCGTVGTALSVRQCLENIQTAPCGELVEDNCGNSCGVVGQYCADSFSCIQGLCYSLQHLLGTISLPAPSCTEYMKVRNLSGHTKAYVGMPGLNGGVPLEVDCFRDEDVFATGAWMLVRRRSSTASSWHPVSDNAQGAAAYGSYVPDPLDTSQAGFSLSYANAAFSKMLFISGSEVRFLVTERTSLIPSDSEGACLTVGKMLSSDASPNTPSEHKWCLRFSNTEDPLISSNCDHLECSSAAAEGILYAEGDLSNHWADNLARVGGYNVYIQ
eukprot:GCRY01003721.1.p1 GENE.GCRY01003721.1~~GCRY01003721.1.p1  ORF type:complete len:361 (+),score=34.22 GCRY01003721.1:57-1085(+)